MIALDRAEGVECALDALLASRLTLLCGAGLSMAPPSNLPSANELARRAKQKYDAMHLPNRAPLPASIEYQAEYFFQRGQLETIYLRTYIDFNSFSSAPNRGHYATADLLLTGAITTAISTNVDQLIENAGTHLFGQVGAGVSQVEIAKLPPNISPLLKVHGCWSKPGDTIWAPGQVSEEPISSRLAGAEAWLVNRLLDRDILVVGFWTDWDYLNNVLEATLGTANPSRVIVVDPCDIDAFQEKAPTLYALGMRASKPEHFVHIKCSGDAFLDELRVAFSRSLIQQTVSSGATAFSTQNGADPSADWFSPESSDSPVLWQIRRDLEGCAPNEPAKSREPFNEPLLGMLILQLQARGAKADGSYWALGEHRIRVLRAANQPLHEVEYAFSRETAPAVAPDYVIAVGAESLSLPTDIARGDGPASIVRGSSSKWLCRSKALEEFNL